MIVDDEINATIVRPLPPGAKLHAIVDACHSGTVLDLPFLCRMNRYTIWFMVPCNDRKFRVHRSAFYPYMLSSSTVKQCPADNDRYVKNCRNGRSPKEMRWWFHNDKV